MRFDHQWEIQRGNQVTQVLFGWDGGHLHLFRAGKKQYADQFTGLEGTGDEHAVRIRDVLTPGAKIGYTCDFGAGWEHEITLEQTTPLDPGQDYPVCVAFRGDSPVEYWSEEEPEEPEPFGQNEVNRRLAALGRQSA
jgi:Plasmid pRiA4b ORF-3-like protein